MRSVAIIMIFVELIAFYIMGFITYLIKLSLFRISCTCRQLRMLASIRIYIGLIGMSKMYEHLYMYTGYGCSWLHILAIYS